MFSNENAKVEGNIEMYVVKVLVHRSVVNFNN